MTRSPGRWITAIFTAGLLLAPSSFAFDLSLSGEAVRDAYFLGQRNDDKTSAFFAQYTRHLPLAKTGPYISEVELLTPFAQIVRHSTQNTLGYSAQQAQKDYEARGDTIEVRVRIDFTATYTGVEFHRPSRNPDNGDAFTPRPLDFWKDFGFALMQNKENIPSSEPYAEPIVGEDGTHLGAYVWLDYHARAVSSDEVSFEVNTPDNQHVVATFDLTHLR
jgi:hypothetical protein